MKREQLRKLASKIHRNPGDALAGERVIAQARQIAKPIVVTGTSSHRIQEIFLKSNVLCVIDKSFKLRDEVMTLKRSGD